MGWIGMDLSPEPIAEWGGNPLVKRQPDDIDEAKDVIRKLVSACRTALTIRGNSKISCELDKKEAEIKAAIENANKFIKC